MKDRGAMKGIFSKTKIKETTTATTSSNEALQSNSSLAKILKESQTAEDSNLFEFNFLEQQQQQSVNNETEPKGNKTKKKKKKSNNKSTAEISSVEGTEVNQTVESEKSLSVAIQQLSLKEEPNSTPSKKSPSTLSPAPEQSKQSVTESLKASESNNKKKKKSKKKNSNKPDSNQEEDEDMKFLDDIIAQQQEEQQTKLSKESKKKNNAQSSTNSEKGPKFVNSRSELEKATIPLDEKEKFKIKYGQGKNLVAMGPRKIKDPNWLPPPPGLAPIQPPTPASSSSERILPVAPTQHQRISEDPTTSSQIVYHRSPFTFSFNGL